MWLRRELCVQINVKRAVSWDRSRDWTYSAILCNSDLRSSEIWPNSCTRSSRYDWTCGYRSAFSGGGLAASTSDAIASSPAAVTKETLMDISCKMQRLGGEFDDTTSISPAGVLRNDRSRERRIDEVWRVK